jgi:hypothetical protein
MLEIYETKDRHSISKEYCVDNRSTYITDIQIEEKGRNDYN